MLRDSGTRPSDLEDTSRRSPLMFPARQHTGGSGDRNGEVRLYPGSWNEQSGEGIRVVSCIGLRCVSEVGTGPSQVPGSPGRLATINFAKHDVSYHRCRSTELESYCRAGQRSLTRIYQIYRLSDHLATSSHPNCSIAHLIALG